MKKYSGFTLTELFIVLAIVAIVMAFGMPSFQNFVKNDRLSTQINTLIGHLAYARSEAVLRAQQVGICASSDQASCSGTNWSAGWIVYVDADSSSSFTAGDTILRVNQALSGTSALSSTVGSSFLYDDRGYAVANTGSFTLCDDRGVAHVKSIAISNTGRVRSVDPSKVTSC